MSLDRKDLRVYFKPPVHAAFSAIADIDGKEMYELAGEIIEQYVLDRVHAATVLAQHADVAGLARIRAVSPGSARIEPDSRARKVR